MDGNSIITQVPQNGVTVNNNDVEIEITGPFRSTLSSQAQSCNINNKSNDACMNE